MKFVQKDLEQTADVSQGEGGQLWELGKLILMSIGIILAVYLIVGVVVDIVVANISVETEMRIFGAFTPEGIVPESPENGDDELAMVREVLGKLVAHPSVPRLEYRVFLHPSEKPNAFAFPGGGMGVTKGLLDALKQEVEIAFVIGHELGHFHNRDHLRGMGRALGASICLSVIFGSSIGGDTIANNAMFVMTRKYSQGQEKAADRFGVKLVYDVYGKTDGVEKLFEILRGKDKLPAWAHMLSTHPKPSKRIADLKRYAEALERAKEGQ